MNQDRMGFIGMLIVAVCASLVLWALIFTAVLVAIEVTS
jgi:hypothetical protein